MRKKLILGGLVFGLAAHLAPAQPPAAEGHTFPMESHPTAEREAIRIMSAEKLPSNPHILWTELRPANEADRRHAAEILQQLRASLKRFKDYRVAEQEGFQAFLPDLDLPRYHFTSDRFALIGSLWFRPSKPTSLIYKKNKDKYELIGALFTASQFATVSELNRRVPLSVARWHAHVNICMPQVSQLPSADWEQFGFEGSIITAEACAEAGGAFFPQMFGWMLRVYPFERSTKKIWGQ